MTLQLLSPRIHGLLDYGAAAGLIAFPFLLDLGSGSPVALWLSVAAGIALVGYSLLTDYALSVAGVIPYAVHLALDVAAGLAFLAAPWVLGFSGVTAIYYVAMGAGVLVVVALSERPARPSLEEGVSAA